MEVGNSSNTSVRIYHWKIQEPLVHTLQECNLYVVSYKHDTMSGLCEAQIGDSDFYTRNYSYRTQIAG